MLIGTELELGCSFITWGRDWYPMGGAKPGCGEQSPHPHPRAQCFPGGFSFLTSHMSYLGLPKLALVVKNPPASAGDVRHRFDPWIGKTP